MKSLLRTTAIPLVLLALTACGLGDKFPYSPQFVSTEDIAPTVIPAPPAKDSPAYVAALNTVVARQKHLSPHEIKIIKTEDHIAPTMIVNPVLGANVTEDKFPILYTHLAHAASDAWRISDAAEDYYGSPRPWYADFTRVKLYVNKITRPGYPSGHTTTNTVWAYVIGDLLPCKQPALLARANAIGYHRTEAGAHFPFDVEGGKQLGHIIYSKMAQSADYQTEHTQARTELAAAGMKCPVVTLH